MPIAQKLVVIAILLIAILATGFWLGASARPLNGFLFTIHKLLALGWVIYTAVVVYHAVRPVESRTLMITAIAVLAVSVVVLFTSGSLLSMPRPDEALWLTIHRVTSVLAIAAMAVTARIFILNNP